MNLLNMSFKLNALLRIVGITKNRAFLCLVCLTSLPCFGEITTTDNLYKVELIIFEHLYFDTSASAEYWPKSIYLDYPANRVELKDPEQEEQRRKEELERLERKKALMLSTDYLLDNVAVPSTTSNSDPSDPEQQTSHTDTSNNDSELQEGTEGAEGLSSLLSTLKPFEFLEDEHKQLKLQAEAIARNRAYRILMHESWLQNMSPKEEAPALLIDAGNQYGNNFELQGTITLHIARYLHIATDLWLSQFVPNVGQEPEYWPAIPPSPTQLRWQELEDQILFQEQMAEFQSKAGSSSQGETNFKLNINQYSQLSNKKPTAEFQDEGLQNNMAVENNQLSGEGISGSKEEYLVTQISTMRQKRRMRSEELHYIDHPKFGILIKIMPFDEKEFLDNKLSAL